MMPNYTTCIGCCKRNDCQLVLRHLHPVLQVTCHAYRKETIMFDQRICEDCIKDSECGLLPYTSYPGKQQYCKSKETVMSTSKEKSMGHFIGWKFGVPVKVRNSRGKVIHESRLVSEDDFNFLIVDGYGDSLKYSKQCYSYELIPYHSTDLVGIGNSPRYPVCRTTIETAICNCNGIMAGLIYANNENMKRIPDPPIVTLTIGDKTIELSQETADKLRKDLGV